MRPTPCSDFVCIVGVITLGDVRVLITHEYLELKVIRRLRHTHFSMSEHHVPNPTYGVKYLG